MKVGKGCDIHSGLKVDHSHCWLIEIGDNVTLAPEVYLLAHDASTDRIAGYTKIGKVKIEFFFWFINTIAILRQSCLRSLCLSKD